MHKYMRAIGFSEIHRQELEKVFEKVINNPTVFQNEVDSEGNQFAEVCKDFGDSFGLGLRGIYLEDDSFEVEYYFPYYRGREISTKEDTDVEKHAEKESYAGVCDEVRIGVTLIFYLQNVAEYLSVKNKYGYQNLAEGVILGALSVEGKILFPINKTEKQLNNSIQESSKRNHLIAAARDGDEDAIENLTLEDIDTYSLLSRRITHEDILSIVESYFMPYGIESDQYSILGEIMDYSLIKNEITDEKIYTMNIMCNDICFGLCINEKDLIGKPEVGRRFKGNVWMQGRIKYRK